MKKTARNIVPIAALFLILSMGAKAQESDPRTMIEAIIEAQLENIDEETDAALIIEDLEQLLENPININATNANELSKLYLLDPIQINRLLEYVKSYGPVYSVFELATVEGFSRDLLQKIEPFIEFGPQKAEQPLLKDQLKYGRHELILRSLGTLQKTRGYKKSEEGVSPYEGNRFRYYSRYRFEAGEKLSAGITSEKDPGEAFLKGSNKNGFDYYSAHISVKLNDTFEKIIVGDFIVRSGQGLALWQGYTMGKSINVLAVSKTGQGLRPYTSVDENAFFRGTAGTLRFGKTKLILYYSRKNIDGNIETDGDGKVYFTSLQSSGYHRTESEITDENSVKTQDAGAVLSFNFRNFKVGGSFVYQQFDKPLIRSPQLYNRFRFSGSENYTASIDYLFNKGKYQFFGEAAISKSKGVAFVQGAVARLNDQISFAAQLRHFDKNYHALWGNTFSEGTSVNNESGLYFGTKILPAKHITLSAYSDMYRSKWATFSTFGPSKGWDILTQADVRLSRKHTFYICYKNEEKDQKYKSDNQYINLPEQTQKVRLHFNAQLSEQLKSRTRFEYAHYKHAESENGYMIYQDFQYTPAKLPLNLSVRAAWYDTESYNSRIYAYENDLLYTFSVPAYYGKGFRTYLNAKYSISNHFECWLKFANTRWTDRETISSGYNEINGKCKTELKIQLRLKF